MTVHVNLQFFLFIKPDDSLWNTIMRNTVSWKSCKIVEWKKKETFQNISGIKHVVCQVYLYNPFYSFPPKYVNHVY